MFKEYRHSFLMGEMVIQSTHSDGDNIRYAVFAIIFTVFVLSLGDALIKGISVNFPLWQIFVIHSAMVIPVLIVVIKTRNLSLPLMPLSAGWMALRSLALTFSWVTYYIALPKVDLSVAAAVLYTLPLFITLFAAFFLGDKVGLKGWIAVFLGFIGVLLIVKPQADEFSTFALLPLVSAILYALAMIMTRVKCKKESPLILSFWLNMSFIGVGATATLIIWFFGPIADAGSYHFMLGNWISMGSSEWLSMALLATAICLGSIFAAIAYQSGQSSIVSTFDFAYLPFVAIWGFLFYSEIPDALGITGIFIITGAGILAVRR